MTISTDERPGCLARILGLFGLSKSRKDKAQYHYRLRDDFLSNAELSFFRVLQNAAPANTLVLTKVNLGDLFYVPNSAPTPQAQRNKINHKHVDFLLCDAATLRPLAGIELDDSSHKRHDRVVRDALMEEVFRTANLTLLRFPVKQGYQQNQVAAQLQQVVSQLQPSTQPQPKVNAASTPPACPKCGEPMVLRTARSGPQAGQQFYGCTSYPQCRGMVALGKP